MHLVMQFIDTPLHQLFPKNLRLRKTRSRLHYVKTRAKHTEHPEMATPISIKQQPQLKTTLVSSCRMLLA